MKLRANNRLAGQIVHHEKGFSLIELMIALVLGLIMVAAFGTVYFSSQSASRRVDQLSTIQQSVRTAFEFFTTDIHSVGMTGCAKGRANAFVAPASASLTDNFNVGIEGFDAADVLSYPLSTTTSVGAWNTNIASAGGTVATIPPLMGPPLTQASDILFLRTASNIPLRLGPDASGSQITVELRNQGGVCSSGVAAASGFCAGSWGLIANCTSARVFQVANQITTGGLLQLNLTSALPTPFVATSSEVFTLQTVAYYVRAGSRPDSFSLYRRVFDGDDGIGAVGDEQELIEDVESLHVLYGIDEVDNVDSTRDYAVEQYVPANAVPRWSRVVSVRMSVLIRARDPVRGDVTLPATIPMAGFTVTLPTAGERFDRRVFTTTITLRNRTTN